MTETRFLTMPDGRKIAHRYLPGKAPAIVFLPGYMSDMAGGKAQAVFEWALAHGQACLLLDYSGCGESPGDFADGTLSRWREEVLAVVEAHCPDGVVFIGSSMGGWMMLLCALALSEQFGPDRVSGLIGIAPAPDFTEWGFTEEQKAQFRRGETVFEENIYGPQPTPTHAGLWADGETLRLLHAEIPLDCPVRLQHGQADPDVPHEISLRLARALRSSNVQVTLIKDGDHRLSREQDIALLLGAVAGLAGGR